MLGYLTGMLEENARPFVNEVVCAARYLQLRAPNQIERLVDNAGEGEINRMHAVAAGVNEEPHFRITGDDLFPQRGLDTPNTCLKFFIERSHWLAGHDDSVVPAHGGQTMY